jgi:hydrogenase maturation protease
MSRPRVLVAGVGNVFLADDGFGVEVARRLAVERPPLPAGVTVADFGIRGVHLAFELLDGYDAAVLVDAVPLGEAPGTLAVVDVGTGLGTAVDSGPDIGLEDGFEGDTRPAAPSSAAVPPWSLGEAGFDAHSMNPALVVQQLARLGARLDRLLVVGCEPATLEEGIGLSAPVAAAVGPAIDLLREVLADLDRSLAPRPVGTEDRA